MLMQTDCERWGSQDELPRMDQVGLKIAHLGQSVGAHASLASPLPLRQLLDSSCGSSNMQGEQTRGGAHGEVAGGGRGLVIGAGWGMSDVQRKRAFAQSQVGYNHNDARLDVFGAAAPHLICAVSVLQLDSSLRVQTFLTLPIACREAWNTKQNLVQRRSHGFQAGQNFHNPYDLRHFNHQLEAGSHHLGSKLGEYCLQMSETAATTISSSLTVLPVSLFPHTAPVQRATHHHLG